MAYIHIYIYIYTEIDRTHASYIFTHSTAYTNIHILIQFLTSISVCRDVGKLYAEVMWLQLQLVEYRVVFEQTSGHKDFLRNADYSQGYAVYQECEKRLVSGWASKELWNMCKVHWYYIVL